ncbi:MAG: S41 family peptidase [Chloroflexi bacterium]|nr:S41 family peptidase [Chloroflexota bacterium]
MQQTRWDRVLIVILLALGIALASTAIGLALGFYAGRLVTTDKLTPSEQGAEMPHPDKVLTPPKAPEGAPENFDVFWQAYDILREHFYGDVPDGPDLTYAAIRGVLQALHDPFTSFLEPKTAKLMSEDMSGTFEGIGAQVKKAENGGVLIVHVFPGSPAEKAGLQDGDIIIKVDGEDITHLSLLEQIMKIRGPAGSKVVLTIVREGVRDPIEVTVIRGKIEIPIVEYRMEGDIGYVKLSEFNALGVKKVKEAIKELEKEHPKGLIFDLRNNPGGYLHVAIGVASQFLPGGKVVLIERWKDGREEVYKSERGGVATDIPLVVLVNRGSASASEIVAGALQDHKRAVLIGERTFGKGSVQQPFELRDGSELRVTIAHWLTPNGREIHMKGIEPDIPVEIPKERGKEDVVLQRALEYFRTGK